MAACHVSPGLTGMARVSVPVVTISPAVNGAIDRCDVSAARISSAIA
jgi:hypothetical protein